MALSSGSRLGPYEVLAPIGAGGMGEVYRARDTRLEREVAVKVLPERVAKDSAALARFEREARAVAGLNDPHVCSLFDFGIEGDVHFAVFELLEGDTLRERLTRGAVSPSKAVELAMQICQGLAAAHAKGIVHRDVKPENLFLTPKGLKILDFGLAKLQPMGVGAGEANLSEEPTLSAHEQLTGPGMAPGTAAYMSPEQARGESADARSDIFATGVVLFETLSGERPFRRATHPETLTAILREDPPELTSPSGPVSPALERIVRRCLEKDPGARFQSAHDLGFALEAVGDTSAPARTKTATGRRWVWAGLVAAAIVLVGSWAAWKAGHQARTPAAPEASRSSMTVTPVTTDKVIEFAPALSPDGRLLAFLREGEQGYDLLVKQIAGGAPLLVAQGVAEGAGLSWLYGGSALTWSPDGQEVAFIRHVLHPDGGVRPVIAAVPALGGNERELATGDQPWERRNAHAQAVDWSPDGTSLALTDIEKPGDEPGVFLVSLETGTKRRLTRPPQGLPGGDSSPRFSPDGRTVAFVRGSMPQSEVFVVSTEGGDPRQLTTGNWATGGLDWAADGESIVFSCIRHPRGEVFGLWRVPAAGGDPEPLDIGEGGCWPTVSRSGGRMAYARVEHDRDIWRVGGPAVPEEERRPHRFISSTFLDYAPRFFRDGDRILFTSQRSGFGEVWMADADGTRPRQVTALEDPATMPGYGSSADGQQIAVMSGKGGSWDIYLVSLTSGRTHPLTTSPANEGGPSWSQDGRWIYFGTNRGGSRELWKMAPQGGEAIQLTRNGGTVAREWGEHLYFTKSNPFGGPPGLWRMPLGGGDEVRILDLVIANNWGLFEQGICYLNITADPGPAIELYEFATGQVSRILVLDEDTIPFGMSVSPDGRWILFVKREEQSDLMLVESFE